MRVLLIEDDQELAALILEGLAKDGFEPELAANAKEGFALAGLKNYAALIVDVMLPEGQDAGFQLAGKLRQAEVHTPILFLTARADMNSKLQGLEIGGDDYLPKPFDFRELRARLRSLVRRSSGHSSNILRLPGGFEVQLESGQVFFQAKELHLTPREYALLEVFALNPGRIFSREDLIERIWAGDSSVTPKIVDVYISSLRRKLSETLLETMRGRGYRLGS